MKINYFSLIHLGSVKEKYHEGIIGEAEGFINNIDNLRKYRRDLNDALTNGNVPETNHDDIKNSTSIIDDKIDNF